MSIVILGVDLGKNSCSIVGVDGTGAVVVRRTMRRQTLIEYVAKLPQCVVAMEACVGRITWDGCLLSMGTRSG
jgi:transposase